MIFRNKMLMSMQIFYLFFHSTLLTDDEVKDAVNDMLKLEG